jgi:hypothetical protein
MGTMLITHPGYVNSVPINMNIKVSPEYADFDSLKYPKVI